jgi:hypothetical protein
MSSEQENHQQENLSEKTLTVKFQLDDSENILAINFPFTISCRDFRVDIAKKFKISSSHIRVFHQKCGEILDDCLFKDLTLNDFGIIEIKLKLTDEAVAEGVGFDTNIYYSNFNLPDIITVHVLDENDEGTFISRDIVVEIENKSIRKPFIGGYVDKKTSKMEKFEGILRSI